MQSVCYRKQKTKFCNIYSTPTVTHTPKKQQIVIQIFQMGGNGRLGAEQNGNMKMLQFNSSGVQGPKLTEQRALKLFPYKIMVL
jgi:hypothetical protein